MSRIRTVKPEFWTSEQVVECSPIARLLFIGMWNFCDDAGIHPASQRRVKMEIFPADPFSEADVSGWITELVKVGLLAEFEAEGQRYWKVTGWKHQKIDRPSYKYPKPTSSQIDASDSSNVRRTLADSSTTDRGPLADRHPPEGKGKESNGGDTKPPQSPSESNGATPRPSNGKTTSKLVSIEDVTLPDQLDTPEARAALTAWLEHHRTINKPYKSVSAVERLLQGYATEGPAAFVAAVDHSIAQNYQGVYRPKANGHLHASHLGPGLKYDPNAAERDPTYGKF